MPKKPRTTNESESAGAGGETPPQPSAMPSSGVRKSAKTTKSRATKSTAARKTPARRKPQTAGAPAPLRREPTDDDIRIRAYFIAERRVQMGIAGTHTDDWLEARRQLEEEERDVAS